MDVALASSFASLDQEIDCIVEDTCDILTIVIFQVIALVFDPLFLVVVITVICRAVDHMSDAKVLKDLSITSDKVTTKVQEVVDNLRADALVILILVGLP